ncbi:MAG: antibiotic biosynthesis monooxygenase [Novipirellula sp. JB048]
MSEPTEPTEPTELESPATILATAYPAAGKEHQWEQAIGELIRTSLSFPGNLGALVLKPNQSSDGYYRVITKFDSRENMQRWYHSEQRREKVAALEPFQSRPADIHHLTGLETWFESTTPDGLAVPTPPKYKMAVVVWIAVYATVLPLIAYLKPLLGSWPPLLASAVLAAISVAMMTWIILPLLTWGFKGWLYPKRRGSDSVSTR